MTTPDAGLLNIDKPRGITSHDVVDAIRHITGIRKVGHAGALDPMATGVLLLCIGRATRLAEYLTSSAKGYRATVRLGIETDTYDADGQVVETRPVSITRDQVEAALDSFRGSIVQVPPMYSAVKRQGQPLYKLARQGITVERKARPVSISQLTITEWSPLSMTLQVTCSAGTYVRSLVHDLGQALDCGAHLANLIRTSSGSFEIEHAIALADLTPENWRSHLYPMETAVADLPQIRLNEQSITLLIHGQAIPLRPEHPRSNLAQAVTIEGQFVALIRLAADGTSWLPHKVFAN